MENVDYDKSYNFLPGISAFDSCIEDQYHSIISLMQHSFHLT